jgi:hypothetical protein
MFFMIDFRLLVLSTYFYSHFNFGLFFLIKNKNMNFSFILSHLAVIIFNAII